MRDETVQTQQRLAVGRSERIPALTGEREEVEVVLVGVGVVEVAGRAVRGPTGMAATESLEHKRALTAPGERPRGGQPHHAAPDDDDAGPFAHASIFAGRESPVADGTRRPRRA